MIVSANPDFKFVQKLTTNKTKKKHTEILCAYVVKNNLQSKRREKTKILRNLCALCVLM